MVTKHLSGHRSPHGSLAVSGATQGAGCLAIHHNPTANVTKSTFGCFLCLRQAYGSVRGISFRVLRSDGFVLKGPQIRGLRSYMMGLKGRDGMDGVAPSFGV